MGRLDAGTLAVKVCALQRHCEVRLTAWPWLLSWIAAMPYLRGSRASWVFIVNMRVVGEKHVAVMKKKWSTSSPRQLYIPVLVSSSARISSAGYYSASIPPVSKMESEATAADVRTRLTGIVCRASVILHPGARGKARPLTCRGTERDGQLEQKPPRDRGLAYYICTVLEEEQTQKATKTPQLRPIYMQNVRWEQM